MEARKTSFSLAPCPSSSFLIPTTLLFLPPVLASTQASAWLCCDMLFLHFYILASQGVSSQRTPAPSEGGCLNYK